MSCVPQKHGRLVAALLQALPVPASSCYCTSLLLLFLQVPSLAVGQLLIRSLYQAQPQLNDCSQEQLLELVTLADSLDAKKAAFAASMQLQLIAACQEDELEWSTVMRIMSLPPACPELPAYKPLLKQQ
jgi:hypothetical protein